MNKLISASTFAARFVGPSKTYTESRLDQDLQSVEQVERAMRTALENKKIHISADDQNPIYEASKQFLDVFIEQAANIFWRRSKPTSA